MKSISDLLKSDEYSSCIAWIHNARSKKKTWDEIDYACKNDEEGLEKFLSNKADDDFWIITPEEWHLLVSEIRKVEESGGVGFIGDPHKTLIGVPSHPGSCWVKYKEKLQNSNNFTYLSIKNIEKSSQKIISQLELSTEQKDPVRGMVVGNVQSGKTANMAGVLAMAADYGYNFFVILTGTIDNLRKQTRERLIGDLSSDNCNVVFNHLDYLSAKTAFPNRLQDLKLDNTSNRRYLAVCLKNSKRLQDLLNWFNTDSKAKEKLKVLVIDDEADQAGVNTKDVDKDEQTKISRLIKNIVFGRNAKDLEAGPYHCMNYIGYTATPYANFLNESGNDTLYPKNFITLLNTPTEYMGPQQIFGVDDVNDGLNIVNSIDQEDIDYINDDEALLSGALPLSLKESLHWFICSIACFRYWNLKRPVSMLIHTSQKVERHFDMAKALTNYLKSIDKKTVYDEIKTVYINQLDNFTLEDFKNGMPDYNEVDKVKNYPSFEELLPEIKKILDLGLTHIELDDDSKLTYNEGIHLCVDNCKRNALSYEFEMRIVYPDKNDPIMEKSPAFIIIGGSTLSRGLTLNGLTTSYFLRSTSQADTLMQMGRWFGYRSGYELLPRIWLSKNTASRFNRLTKLDYDLRNELYTMELKGLSPKDYAPRLDSFPDYKLLVLTAKNKMQSSIEFKCTFYNKTAQTTWFYRDDDKLNNNFNITKDFLDSLGEIDKKKIEDLKNPFVFDNSLIWFNVDYSKTLEYLQKLEIPSQAATFVDYKGLKEWFDKEYELGDIKNFTIIAGGVKDKINNDVILKNGTIIHLQNRTRIEKTGPFAKDYNEFIDLNTISQSDDRLMDIDCSKMDKYELEELKSNKLKFIEKRVKYASNNTPLLIIYIVDKDSGKGKEYQDGKNYKRYSLESLNLKNHIVGYYIYIPYGKYDTDANSVTVELKYDNNDDGKEIDLDELED